MQLVIGILLLFLASISDTAIGDGEVVGYGYRIETAETGNSSLHAHLRLINTTSTFGPDIEYLDLVAR